MNLNKIFKNIFLVLMAGVILTACATTKKVETTTGQMQGDVYKGSIFLRVGTKSTNFCATTP